MLRRSTAWLIAMVMTLACLTISSTVIAQTETHKKNIVQRHPTATGVVAGVATRHALKASAKKKKATGQKLNFAEKHPTLSGIAAGVGTRHVIKKHTH